MSKSSILLIYTGGTIGMMKNAETGALDPVNFDELYKLLPSLEQNEYQISHVSFEKLVDSSDIKPDFWIELAGVIEKNYEQYDGFVILHGSDTMAYSASMLSFMLENLSKPVVFTGSQLPLGARRTDGRENIINAIEVALAKKEDKPIVPEVCLFFENHLFRGNRVSKFNANDFQAFISGNYPALADAGVQIHYRVEHIAKPNHKKLKVHKSLDTNVTILKLYPGISEDVVRAVLHSKSLRAVILETYGSGNAPTDKWFIQLLKEAIDNGIIILNVSQCAGGLVEMGKYSTSLQLHNIGVVSGYDITTEAAIAKLMFLLGQKLSNDEIKKMLNISLRGEITV